MDLRPYLDVGLGPGLGVGRIWARSPSQLSARRPSWTSLVRPPSTLRLLLDRMVVRRRLPVGAQPRLQDEPPTPLCSPLPLPRLHGSYDDSVPADVEVRDVVVGCVTCARDQGIDGTGRVHAYGDDLVAA